MELRINRVRINRSRPVTEFISVNLSYPIYKVVANVAKLTDPCEISLKNSILFMRERPMFPVSLGRRLMFLPLQFGTFLKRNTATPITQTAVKILLHYHFYSSIIYVSQLELLFYMFIFFSI